MPTNSADPARLQGFAQSLEGPAAAAGAALEQAAWALARYRVDCADLPVDTPAPNAAADAIGLVRDLTTGTRRVATAFVLADAGRGPAGVRYLTDNRLVGTLAAVAEASGVELEVDHGLVTDGDASWSLGPEGLTAGVVGSVLSGTRYTATKDFEVGPIHNRTEVEVMVGTELEGEANITIGRDGVTADAHLEAFSGATWTGRNQMSSGPIVAEQEFTLATGVGSELDGSIDLGWDGIEIDFSFLAAVGYGGGFGGSISVDPGVLREPYEWGEDRVEDLFGTSAEMDFESLAEALEPDGADCGP